MLGWIKKIGGKDAVPGSSGAAGSTAPGRVDTPTHGVSGGQQAEISQGLQRDATRSVQPRRGSFLDVGAFMGRGKRKDERGQGATAAAAQLDAQRAEKISCVAFKLVREIQRILKEARETAAASGAGGAARVATTPGRPAASTPRQQPKGTEATAGGTEAAGSETAAAAAKRSRWAGTGELLNLLNGGSLGGPGEAEDRVDTYGSAAEVKANMEDLVEQALRPESHGDLCGILLEASAGDGQHPAFVKLCVDAGLPSNLVHCLRIMRVVEFESAMHNSVNVGGDNDDGSVTVVAGEGLDSGDGTVVAEGEQRGGETGGKVNSSTAAVTFSEQPLTKRATERIGQLLVTLCSDKSAGVGEQIKPHLPGLLSLAVSAYPLNGSHVQKTARAVVEALMAGCLNSSMVWLLHYNKAMLDVVGELRHLCGLDEIPASKSPTRKGGRTYTPRATSPLGRGGDGRKRSPTPGGTGSSAGSTTNEPPSTELIGEAAEAEGLWLSALRATVATVRCASHFVPAFVQDFESAGGYETVAYMVRKSSMDRLPAMLEQVCLLVSALASGGVDAAALRGGEGMGGPHQERSELMASNPSAFGIIQSLLAECTPPVEAVCLQGVMGRVSTSTCDMTCLAGGQSLVDQGLDPEDAVVMVAERAVAMRLDRWGREHGFATPDLVSIPSGTTSSAGTDDEDGGGSSTREGGMAAPEGRDGGSSRAWVGAGETAADVAEGDEFRLRLLEAVLGLYSNHPLNYGELEARFHALSFFLCALPYYESRELKGLALKTLEVICVSFKDVHPRDALHSTSTAFTVCLDHMMGLLSDPLCSPGVGRKVPLVGSTNVLLARDEAEEGGGSFELEGVGAGDEWGENGGVWVNDDIKVAAALDKASVLLEDADMMRRMLEKLLEFDEKKYTAMFQATGILDQVLHPLLKRVLSLHVGGCPGAPKLWRAMRHPGLVSEGVQGTTMGGTGRDSGGISPLQETGALALVSRATGLLCGTLALLLGYSPAICRQFRALRMHDTLYDVIRDFGPPSTEAALLALERASSSEPSGVPEDMAFLIELVQGSKSRSERWRQAAALMGLRSILMCKHQAVKDVWRESCGFEAALAAVSSLDAAFSPIPSASNAAPALQGVKTKKQTIDLVNNGDQESGLALEQENGSLAVPVDMREQEEKSQVDTVNNKDGTPLNARGGAPSPLGYRWNTIPADEACLMEAEHFRVIQAAVFTLVASASAGPVGVVRGEHLVGCRANRRYLRREISYDSVTCCLVNSGVVASPRYAGPAVKLLFTMVTEVPCENMPLEADSDEKQVAGGGLGSVGLGGGISAPKSQSPSGSQHAAAPAVRNADAVMVILGVLPYVSEEIAWAALGALNEVVRAGGFAEAEALVAAGAARKAADVLAKALHAQRASENNGIRNDNSSSTGSMMDGGRSPLAITASKGSSDALLGDFREVTLPKVLGADGGTSYEVALRNRVPELPARGTVAVLSAHLELTERLQRRLVEFMVLVASRHVTITDLAPLIRSITLPLVMDSRGHVAPPTVWPSGLALPPPGNRSGSAEASTSIGALWLPGWGTFLSSSAAGGAAKSAGTVTVAGRTSIGGVGRGGLEDEDERWRWLDVLTAMSAHTEDSTPFLRLGGSPHTDMSGIFHEVSRAGQRGRANSFSSNPGGASTSSTASGASNKGTLWRGQQKALVEASLEEGVRMVHVPGLEGSATAGTGTGAGSGGGSSASGGGGGSGSSGASWPGPAGYSFICWMRFNPPEPGSAAASRARGDTPFEGGSPEAMKAWGADAERAAALAAAVTAASAHPTATAVPTATAGIASDATELLAAELPAGAELEDNGDLPPVAKSPVLGSLGSPDRGAPTVVGEKAAADWIANATKVERRTSTGSVDSGYGGRGTEEDESVPRPHLPGRRVLWLFTVASPDGRAFVQLFLDLDLMRFCLRGSAFCGEIRFDTPRHLVCGGARVWHHVVLTHARPKSRILGTRDKLCLWVDGELADTVKVDATSFTTAEGPPSAYMGCPHPQAFLDPAIGATVAPLWHLGPCALLTEVVELAPLMFAVGPEYTGFWGSENPLEAVSSANAARALRHLQALGGEAGFAAIGGDVPHALHRRTLRELDKYFNVTERAYYWSRTDRASVTDSFYLLLAPEQFTFAYNTRHMERPGGPTPPLAAGSGAAFPVSDTLGKDIHGSAGSAGDVSYDTADGSSRPSQVPPSAKRAATSPSLVTGWLFNVAREVSPPSAGAGPIACVYGASVGVTPSSLPRALSGAGGPAILFPLLQRAQSEVAICATLRLIGRAVRGGGAASAAYMQTGGGYLVLAGLLRSRRSLLGPDAARACFEIAVDRAYDSSNRRREDGQGQRASSKGRDKKDENRPWGGEDNGRNFTPVEKAEELKKAAAWGWEKDVASMPREDVRGLFDAVAGVKNEDNRNAHGPANGKGKLCPFVLLTDPYALKHLVMNHQVWGLGDRELMVTVLQLMHSLVSPHNVKPYCRFNARVLHRIGLFRWGLHFLLEASEPPSAPAATARAAAAGTTSSAPGDTSSESATSTATANSSAGTGTKNSRKIVPIAGFGGVKRPAAVVAAAGLDIRDGFMVSCTLLLQRVLATCTVQRDFDRVVGATLSTLADGGAAGAQEKRRAGSDPAFAAAEEVLQGARLLGGEGSAGDKVLSGQAMVRLYLVRMLLEIVTLPVAAASKGEIPAAEGAYVGGVGSPCARAAQAAVEAMSLGSSDILGSDNRMDDRAGVSQLECWVYGVPPVVDVGADGVGVPSPLYVGRQRLYRSVCTRALRPDWFISLLETCREEAGIAWTFRLLAAMLQGSDDFASSFQDADGFRAMGTCLPRYSASLPVLLTALALALGVPVAALPATGEGMNASSILSLLRRNAGTAMGPAGVGSRSGGGKTSKGGDDQPRPFVRVCVAKVLLPALRFNVALMRRADAAGVGTEESAAEGVGGESSTAAIKLASTTGGTSTAVPTGDGCEWASEWRRAKRASEVVSAAFWEALMNDPSFRVTCRSPDVVGALVDVLGGTWDEPEPVMGGKHGAAEGEEMEVEKSGGSAAAVSSSPHPPAELLRLVIAEIVSSGGSVIFPSLVRLFNAGAAVMAPTREEPSPSTDSTDALPASLARDLSPPGREKGASAGGFQRAMLRHLDACCRDAIALSAAADSGRRGPQQQQRRSGAVPNAALDNALGSLAAVAAAVAEAAAEGLLPGVETGHLAVGFLLSVLRQVYSASASGGSSSGTADGARATALGAYHVATIVALRRAIQRESGRGARMAKVGAGVASVGASSLVQDEPSDTGGRTHLALGDEGNDLLEECLLMMAHNFDTLLGEDRRGSAGCATGSPNMPPLPPNRVPMSPKPRTPILSAATGAEAEGGPDISNCVGKRKPSPPPLDLGSSMDPSQEVALTASGIFADTPVANPRWASRFDFPDDANATMGMGADPTRLAMTFSAVELASIGVDGKDKTAGVGQVRVPLISTAIVANPSTGGRSPTASTSKSLWESAAAGAAGLVAAADRGSRVGGGNSIVSVGGGGADGGANGMRESIVHRLRSSSGRAFIAGFVAELRGLLLSDSDSVRKLATRLAAALLARRRSAVQELLGEELLSTGFSMLEHPLGADATCDPISEDEDLAEGTRSQAFALWLTGVGQEAALREGFDRAADRAYALIPHVSSAEGLTLALTRAEILASGGGSGGGNDGLSALSRLGSGVGGALGALAAGAPNRKTITVDRVIQRADMIARTYERVATSHGRWVWSGADDLAWASRAWTLKLASLRGKASLWEGGLFGRLMRSPEAIAAARPGSEGVVGGVDEERFKLDMDEGPERARLRLRPNRAFYDTYEVLAPIPLTPALLKADKTAGQEKMPQSTDTPPAHDASTVVVTAAAVAASAAAVSPPSPDAEDAGETPASDLAACGDSDSTAAAGAVAAEAQLAAVAAAAAVMDSDDSDPMPSVSPIVEGGSSVAAIAALVKTMSETVGVLRGKTRRNSALTSVFDLDDTDTSALLELEELHRGDAPEESGEESSTAADGVEGNGRGRSRGGDQSALPSIPEIGNSQVPAGGETAVADAMSQGPKRKRARDSGGFSLSETDLAEGDDEDDDIDDVASVTTESHLGLDDGEQSEISVDLHDGCDRDDHTGHSGGDGSASPRRSRGRARMRAGSPSAHKGRCEEGEAPSYAQDTSGAAVVGLSSSSEQAPLSAEDPGVLTSDSAAVTATDSLESSVGRVPSDSTAGGVRGTGTPTTVLSKSSGPGATAREEGWADRELFLGLLQPEDSPVVSAHDVSRSIGGVEVKRGLLVVCRSALYFVAGFGRGPPLRAGGGLAGAAGASGGGGGKSKDPLHGVRRLEEWELGGGAGGIGGGDDDGEAGSGGAKIQVTLRRSAADLAAGPSSAPRDAGKGGASRSMTAEQAGGSGGGKGEQQVDEIVALGHIAVQRIVLDQVHAVYKRRYQLRDVGLEIFDILGRSVLVSFETQEMQEDVLTYLLARGLPASIFARGKSKLRLAAGSSHAQARAAYKKFMQTERTSWTKKWQLGRCTNFEYLMAINTLAGRSFNDLTQYPVFPWVLCDYVSDELDLDNPAVYRDLSKPMGAIGEARARQFRERYAAVIEAAEETGRDPDPPPFHYGTHYSCAGYILHYLLRLEPFTRLALGLQGGRFDKPDRLFRDIRSSWESASSENLQDVRELTPEFYTVPEFLVNSNRFDLGVTQKGQAVNHVVLPPWAKGDPREFIRLHRKALESPHVSRNLHEWIGLIFGCKQRGPEAVEAQNVFVHLTYEGEVDIDSIQDPLLRDAALAQIHNFGQTPSLVLKKPHPQRDVPSVVRISPTDGSRSADPAAVEWHASLTPPLCIVGAPDAVALKPVALTSPGGAWQASSGGGVGDARIIRDKVVGVGQGAILYPRSPDKYIRFGGPTCGLSFFQSAGVAASSSKSPPDRLLSSHASLHLAPITALACTEDGQILVTGAVDGTCRLWGVVNLQLGGQVVKSLDLAATLGWHAGPVTCACVCTGSGSAVTGGAGGKVLVWDIRRKSFVRELLGHHNMITSVGINGSNGNVITLAGTELRVWTVNGRLLASCSVTALRRGAVPTCATPTDCPDWQDGVVAATGHDNGDVLLWGIQWGAGLRNGGGGHGRREGGRGGDRKDLSPTREGSGGGGSGGGRAGVVRQLKLLRVLSGAHQKPITFVRVSEGGRELLVGDAKGEISRWQCIRLDHMSTEELNQLV